MKKSLFLPAILVALAFTSCTKDQIDPMQDTPEKAEARLAINTVTNSFLTGSWQVSNVVTNSNNVTSKYKEYSFSFATNGSLILKESLSTNVVGKWVVSYVDNKTRVSFTFLSNSGFDDIDGDWTLMEGSTSQKMVLQGVVESKSYLTLEKK